MGLAQPASYYFVTISLLFRYYLLGYTDYIYFPLVSNNNIFMLKQASLSLLCVCSIVWHVYPKLITWPVHLKYLLKCVWRASLYLYLQIIQFFHFIIALFHKIYSISLIFDTFKFVLDLLADNFEKWWCGVLPQPASYYLLLFRSVTIY